MLLAQHQHLDRAEDCLIGSCSPAIEFHALIDRVATLQAIIGNAIAHNLSAPLFVIQFCISRQSQGSQRCIFFTAAS